MTIRTTVEFDKLFSKTLKFRTSMFIDDYTGLRFVFIDEAANHNVEISYRRLNEEISGEGIVHCINKILVVRNGIILDDASLFRLFVEDDRFDKYYEEMKKEVVKKLMFFVKDGTFPKTINVRKMLEKKDYPFKTPLLMTFFVVELEIVKTLTCGIYE